MIRVLFDVVHPADVHFFKNAIRRLLDRGDRVQVTSRRKDITLALLDLLGISHRRISDHGGNPAGLFLELLKRDYALWRVCREFRPDVIVSNNSPSGPQVAWMLRRPSIVFDDTEIHRYNQTLYYPFVTEVHSPDCYAKPLGRKQLLFPGYHSLAYLHPDHFSPDPEPLRRAGIDPAERKVLLRFVSWGAMHDVGLNQFSHAQKLRLVRLIEQSARVLVSSEGPLAAELEPYRLDLANQDVHHLLANADLVIGESATMCSEAVTLGTPAVYIDDKGRGYTDEQEKRYGLCFNFRPDEFGPCESQVRELLALEDIRARFAAAHRRMLGDKIDVSAYQLDQIDRLAGKDGGAKPE